MFEHYLRVAVRNLLKHKVVSTVNILGLSIGIACSILILLYVYNELSYDRFHKNADRIYRVRADYQVPGKDLYPFALSGPTTGPAMLAELPEVENMVRLRTYFEGAVPGKNVVRYLPRKDELFPQLMPWVDNSIFEIFSFELLVGNPATALADPFTVVLTEDTAKKIFRDEDPLGKTLTIDGGFDISDYTVTGILKNPPSNSSFPFDMLASMKSLESMKDVRATLTEWLAFDFHTFVLLKEGASPEELEAKLPAMVRKYVDKERASRLTLRVQPLTDIRLRSKALYDMKQGGNINYVYGTLTIAFFLLLIAGINFMNLSTARSAHRAKDVGMRKASGAFRSQLIVQFLSESVLMALIALFVAVILVELALPAFNNFVGEKLAFLASGDWAIITGALVLTLLLGLLAGSYPAFFLSAFQPVSVLQGTLQSGVRSSLGRKVLVIFQFSISIALMIATWVVYDQLSFMRDQDLGWNREQILGIPIRDVELRQRFETLRDEISRRPSVTGVTFSSTALGNDTPDIGVYVEGLDEPVAIDTLIGDSGFVDTFDLEIIAGRNFRPKDENDVQHSFLINEKAVKQFGWEKPEDALGKAISWQGLKEGEIIGVFKDFHFEPLYNEIKPLVMHVRPLVFHYSYVKVQGDDIPGTLDFLELTWKRLSPGRPFDYFFVNEAFERFYDSEARIGKIFGVFSVITVFVSCLGLFALASFVAEQRTKEIGIRKVHGASTGGVVLLLSKEFSWLVVLANVVAWPVAFLFMRNWLEGFAYRTSLHPLAFVLAGVAALAIAWLTVSYHSLKAASMSPARSLRYE